MSSRALALGLAALLVLPGCVSLEMGRMKREIQRDVEAGGTAEVGRGFAVAFGRGTIGSSRFLSRLVAPSATEPYRALSRHVRQVKVARYDVAGTFDGRDVGRPSALDRYEADGWIPLATVRDEDQAAWVLYREDARTLELTDLLAIALSEEDLVLTRLRGDLSALVLDAAAMGAQHDVFGGAFDATGVFGPVDAEEPDLEGASVDAAP